MFAPRPEAPRFLAFAALALSMIMVGANVPLGKYLTAHLPISWIGLMRCGAAIAVLIPLMLVRSKLHGVPRLRPLLGLFVLGFSGVFLYPCFLLWGLKSTTALGAGAITATLPAIVALFSIMFLRERPTPRLLAGICFAVAALMALNLSSADGSSPGTLGGNALILVAVAAEAIYVIAARQVSATQTPTGMALGVNVIGLIAFAILAIANGEAPPPEAPIAAWIGAATFGVTSSVLALLLWFWGIAHVSAARAAVFTVFLPLSAAAVSIAFLGERPGALAIIGVVAVIVAIFLTAERAPRRLPLG